MRLGDGERLLLDTVLQVVAVAMLVMLFVVALCRDMLIKLRLYERAVGCISFVLSSSILSKRLHLLTWSSPLLQERYGNYSSVSSVLKHVLETGTARNQLAAVRPVQSFMRHASCFEGMPQATEQLRSLVLKDAFMRTPLTPEYMVCVHHDRVKYAFHWQAAVLYFVFTTRVSRPCAC